MVNKKKWVMIPLLIGIIAILAICMVGSVSAATYTVSPDNKTSDIVDFFSKPTFVNGSSYSSSSNSNSSPFSILAKGDTVIFKAGTYNMNLNIRKDVTLKAQGKVNIKSITIYVHNKVNMSGFTINKRCKIDGDGSMITGNTFLGKIIIGFGSKNTIKNNEMYNDIIFYNAGCQKNKILNNKFKKGNICLSTRYNIIQGNTLSKGNIIYYVKKSQNTVKKNKEIPYAFLEIKIVQKTNKGLLVKVTNKGTKNAGTSYDIYSVTDVNGWGVSKLSRVKVDPIKKNKSKTFLIPKNKYYKNVNYTMKEFILEKNKLKNTNQATNNFVFIIK